MIDEKNFFLTCISIFLFIIELCLFRFLRSKAVNSEVSEDSDESIREAVVSINENALMIYSLVYSGLLIASRFYPWMLTLLLFFQFLSISTFLFVYRRL
jgi:hypothetical protein